MAWSILVIAVIVPPITDGYFPARILPWWALPGLFALSLFVFAMTGNQGLSIKLNKRLMISLDKGKILSIHLNNRKIRNLSPKFIRSMVVDIVFYGEKLQMLGFDSPLNIESWLLAPVCSRHNLALKRFQQVINYGWLKKCLPH